MALQSATGQDPLLIVAHLRDDFSNISELFAGFRPPVASFEKSFFIEGVIIRELRDFLPKSTIERETASCPSFGLPSGQIQIDREEEARVGYAQLAQMDAGPPKRELRWCSRLSARTQGRQELRLDVESEVRLLLRASLGGRHFLFYFRLESRPRRHLGSGDNRSFRRCEGPDLAMCAEAACAQRVRL